jgi:hypothetical protein
LDPLKKKYKVDQAVVYNKSHCGFTWCMYVWEQLHVRAQILGLCARQAIVLRIRAEYGHSMFWLLYSDLSTRQPRANWFLARARTAPAARARPAISHVINLVYMCGNGFPPISTHIVTWYSLMQLHSCEPAVGIWSRSLSEAFLSDIS